MTTPAELIATLPKSIRADECTITTFGALRAEYDVGAYVDDGAPVVVLPGWFADDGNAEVHFPRAASGEAAAQEYVDGGDWGERTRTDWIDVWVWRRAYALDEDGDVVMLALDRERHTIELPPEEPDCIAGHSHVWMSSHSVVGGLKENPGVYAHGGGVIITEVCKHCGCYRITDTWAQRPDTGEQGLEAIEYREADGVSLAWIERCKLESAVELLNSEYDVRLPRDSREVLVLLDEIEDDETVEAEMAAIGKRIGDDYIVTWSRDDFGDVTLHVRVA